MKTLKQIREQTLNEKYKWSWREPGSPWDKATEAERKEHVRGFGGKEDPYHGKKGVQAIIDFGSDGPGSFLEQGYHLSDANELEGSSLSWGELASNSKGEEDDDGTYANILGTPDEIEELFRKRSGWAWRYTKHIPRRELKRAISKGKKFKFPNSPD